jgi:hypothetical protein
MKDKPIPMPSPFPVAFQVQGIAAAMSAWIQEKQPKPSQEKPE